MPDARGDQDGGERHYQRPQTQTEPDDGMDHKTRAS